MRLPEYLKYTSYTAGCKDAFEDVEQEAFGEFCELQKKFPKYLNYLPARRGNSDCSPVEYADLSTKLLNHRIYTSDCCIPENCEIFYFEITTSWTYEDNSRRFSLVNEAAKHNTVSCDENTHSVDATVARFCMGSDPMSTDTPFVSDYSENYDMHRQSAAWLNSDCCRTICEGMKTIGVIVDTVRNYVYFTEDGKFLRSAGFALGNTCSQFIPMILASPCSLGSRVNFGLFEDYEPFMFDIAGFCQYTLALHNDAAFVFQHSSDIFMYGTLKMQKDLAQIGMPIYAGGKKPDGTNIMRTTTPSSSASSQFEFIRKLMLACVNKPAPDLAAIDTCLDELRISDYLPKINETVLDELKARVLLIRLMNSLESGDSSVKKFNEIISKPEFKPLAPLATPLLTLLLLPKQEVEKYASEPRFPDSITNCARPDLILRIVKENLPDLACDQVKYIAPWSECTPHEPKWTHERVFCYPRVGPEMSRQNDDFDDFDDFEDSYQARM